MDTSAKHRTDIQALRGFAVLAVVFYHAKFGIFAGGYLGVDVFFVISGFLITGLVSSGIVQGSFSLKDFYFRRAKRLMPAAYCTLLFSSLLAPWFLNTAELQDFVMQAIGALTFSANFVLWQQTDYFRGDGELKPLLHIWSLAVEEQYYFILPAVLLLTRPPRWLAAGIAACLLSLLLCVAGMYWKPIATFYLLPTRGWELLIGSVASLWTRTAAAESIAATAVLRLLFPMALLSLPLLTIFPLAGAAPGMNALLVCAATAVVVLRRSAALNRGLLAYPFAWTGDFSYSLYLVHWPVLAFLKNAWIGNSANPPVGARALAVLLSFLLAYLQFRYVEQPIHRGRLTFSASLARKTAMASMAVVAIVPVVTYAIPAKLDLASLRRGNPGLSAACEFRNRFFDDPRCMTGRHPSVLVWGDSYAMHLVPGLAQTLDEGQGLVQATKSRCGPLLGLAPHQWRTTDPNISFDERWAEDCIEFNQSVLDYLKSNAAIKIVVMSSLFQQYVSPDNYDHLVLDRSGYRHVAFAPDHAIAALLRAVEAVRQMGIRVVLVAPPPFADFDIARCVERGMNHMISYGGRPGCAFTRQDVEIKQKNIRELLDAIAPTVSVIRFDDWICPTNICLPMIDGTLIYGDAGHLTIPGSILLAQRMHFTKAVEEQAK